MYISEAAPLSLRGSLGVCNQLSVTLGLLVAQLVGLLVGLENSLVGWDAVLGLSAVPCVALLALLPWCPESPRFLLLDQGREDEAVAGECG